MSAVLRTLATAAVMALPVTLALLWLTVKRYRGRGITIASQSIRLARQKETIRTLRHIAKSAPPIGDWHIPYEPPTVRPFYGSPRHLRAVDALADSEAARADWSEVEGWSE